MRSGALFQSRLVRPQVRPDKLVRPAFRAGPPVREGVYGRLLMTVHDPLSTAFLLVETTKDTGEPVWAVKWRSADGQRVRRRLGARAWLARDGRRGWRPRSGRPAPGHLTAYQARRRLIEFVERAEAERAADRAKAAESAAREAAAGGPTFRALAHAWLEYVEFVLGAKPSTLRDYRSMLAEPGTPHRRGHGVAIGRIVAALGDVPVTEVTTAQIEALLVSHAREGVGARSVNKHRQVLCAIFNFGVRPEQATRWRITSNPAAAVAKRREAPPARLEVFTVEQIEALARAAESGAWRGPHDDLTDTGSLARAEEDAEFGELLRVAAYNRPPPRRARRPALARRPLVRASPCRRARALGRRRGHDQGRPRPLRPARRPGARCTRPPLTPPELHELRRLRLRDHRRRPPRPIEVAPGLVRKILCRDVGLGEDEALRLL